MGRLEENISRLQEIITTFPRKVKVLRSESDVNSMDMDKMQSWEVRSFDNDDTELIPFISGRLTDGMEMALVAGGRTKLVVTAGKTVFKK